MNNISLKSEELTYLKKIGEGKDACVFSAKDGLLYKIYKNPLYETSFYSSSPLDSEGVRVAIKGDFSRWNLKSNNNFMNYIDFEGVRLHSSSAIKKAAIIQKEIQFTSLPLSPIYIDGRFKGCVLKRHKHCMELHAMWGLLPKEQKIKLLKKIKRNVDELCKNNIYHLDLANNAIGAQSTELSHSNILVSLSLNPQIIDIDGISALYRERKSENYEELCYAGLNTLFLELLFSLDLANEPEEEDIYYLASILKRNNVPQELIIPLSQGYPTSEMLDELLNVAHTRTLKI